jgi:CheY-like chemotaxis protein
MPGQDGMTLVRRIREQSALSSILIIMLTSADRPEDIVQFRELGISQYLVKPVKQSELFDAIVDILGVAAGDETVGASTPPVETIPPLNVLLAEDSLTNQKLARGLLEKWGHSVTIANNGREAVEAVQAAPFDIVLMDVQMPEMDGLQATKAIRLLEQPTGRHLPIVAMTAHAMADDREQCLAAGMDAYVPKPIRRDELMQVLRSLVPTGGPDCLLSGRRSR